MCGGVERLNDDVFARGSAARSAPTPARVRVRTTTVALVFKILAWVSENTRVRSLVLNYRVYVSRVRIYFYLHTSRV